MAVFSSIKACYYKEISNRPNDDDSSPIRKRIFLESYAITRAASLSNQNIHTRWRRAGLWPVNMAKPLMSKLLVNPLLTTPKTPPLEPKLVLTEALPEVKTPTTTHQLRRLLSDSTHPLTSRRTSQLIQRKITKQFHTQQAQILFLK